jgi:hypothetical protein
MAHSSLLIVALCALVAGAARAEWVELASASGGAPRIAYDNARVRSEPPYVTAWTRVVPSAEAALANGVRYRSVQQKVAVDCAARTWSVIRSEFYDTREAVGAPLYVDEPPREEWQPKSASAGSTGERLIRAVCTSPKPS